MVFHVRSCFLLLESGNGHEYPRKDSICNFKRLYEWNVMLFGPCNSPSTLMKLVLKGFHWKICFIYLDDVIVMRHTFEEKLEPLKQVFERRA